jgi:hypothetical protein
LIDFFNSIGQSRRFGDVGGLSVVPHGRYQIAALRQVTFGASSRFFGGRLGIDTR